MSGLDINEFNRCIYMDAGIVDRYGSWDFLLEEEEVILAELRPYIEGQSILDIGVGGGRTSQFLREISNDYIGIDYSAEMVKRCRQRFPDAAFEVCNACDLGRFDDGRFRFVFFSFNGIDLMSHEDRLQCLREMYRVLQPGGYLSFSAHNMSWTPPPPWSLENLKLSLSPRLLTRGIRSYLEGIRNYLLLRRHQIRADNYVTIVDTEYNYRSLMYFVDRAAQVAALGEIGFLDVKCYDRSGEPIEVNVCNKDIWTYYVARKLG